MSRTPKRSTQPKQSTQAKQPKRSTPPKRSTQAKQPKRSTPPIRAPRDIIITDTAIIIRPSAEAKLFVDEGDIVTFHAPNSLTPVERMAVKISPDSNPPLFGEENHLVSVNTELRIARGARGLEYSWALKSEDQEPMQGKIVVNPGKND